MYERGSNLQFWHLDLAAGITIYVSSAYLNIRFPAVTVVRSAALIT